MVMLLPCPTTPDYITILTWYQSSASFHACCYAQLKELFVFNEDGNHYPFIYFNDFWMLRDKMVQMNDTAERVQLALHVNPMSFWWMQLQQQVGGRRAPGGGGA
jgi:hypothetical protein